MNYIFFGTPRFAEIILDRLIRDELPPKQVICNPDRPVGRDQVMTPPPTKELAQENGIPVHQPDELNFEEFKKEAPENVEAAILAAYGEIIPEEIINYFSKGIIGVHPSLLPKYRGPTPIRSAILNGEKKTGVSLFVMDEKVDHGPVIAREEMEIGDRNYPKLKEDLAELGAKLVREYVPKYLEDKIEPALQNHESATSTSFFRTEDAKVEYSDLIKAIEGDTAKAVEIERMIKALNPEPGVWTMTDDRDFMSFPTEKRVKLLKAHTDKGSLVLDKIHVAGKPDPREL